MSCKNAIKCKKKTIETQLKKIHIQQQQPQQEKT